MSGYNFGQWRCSRGRLRSWRALIAAAAALSAPIAPIAQDKQEFVVPVLNLASGRLLMTETVEVEVTFVEPTAISSVSGLQFGSLDMHLADNESVTITPGGAVADPANRVEGGRQSAASMKVTATAGQAISIHVDAIASGPGYSLSGFRCNYNARSESACDGPGFSEISVESGTLMVGATLTGDGTAVSGPAGGSFDVTISYQ